MPRAFQSPLAPSEAPGVNPSGEKMFRFQMQTARDASGAGIRGGLKASPVGVIRDRIESAASLAMSVIAPKAEVKIQYISACATGHGGLMALPET
jgi:hypothetical protein